MFKILQKFKKDMHGSFKTVFVDYYVLVDDVATTMLWW